MHDCDGVNILIVDASKRSAQIMRRFLAKGIPDVGVIDYDLAQQGAPHHAFDWSSYDVVLLGENFGTAGNGLQWLEDFGPSPNFPAAVLVIAKADARITAKALKAGAHDVIIKRDISPEGLCETVRAAAASERVAVLDGATTAGKQGVSDAQIVARARGGATNDQGYKFKRLIGQGAMSRVYLGERLADKLTVVIKIMDGTLSGEDESVKRFVLEASLAQAIDSPHVVKIFEQGFTDQYGFMAMEFFARGDLKHRIDTGITPQHTYGYMREIAMGLAAIHKVGIIHRDLKPANIMFRADDQLAIADFGISKRADATTQLTQVGSVIGTPYYMSPEQIRAESLDQRADLYSAGVILYEMLTGNKPFDADSLTGIALKHLQSEPDPLPPAVRRFEPIFRRLVEKQRDARYADADELLTDLNAMAKK
ncbi:MAG: serine/threonine protein kinase [Proteobacteria bacterium]|nr:MAG: serine/threonine protein kinase [Pseudomonadota bacterium]